MSLLSLFGFGSNKIKEALRKGAVVIDVRRAYEFDQGKVPGSINIPLDRIAANAGRIRHMNKPIIICSASGERSNMAVSIMKQKGLKEVYNGGSWEAVLQTMKNL